MAGNEWSAHGGRRLPGCPLLLAGIAFVTQSGTEVSFNFDKRGAGNACAVSGTGTLESQSD